MSSSSRVGLENESPKLDLPIFVCPAELTFSPNRKRSLITIFNPYGKEARFHILTTSPRFDLSYTKGILKPNRRIDISIRLFNNQLDDLPIPSEEPETIDYFKVHVQIGPLEGHRQIKICWASCVNENLESDDSHSHLINPNDAKSSNKYKIKNQKTTNTNKSAESSILSAQRSSTRAVARSDVSTPSGSYQANLDIELCKKTQSSQDQTRTQISGFLFQLISLFSVNYELKLVCSFALGLFTYRLISTMPE